MFTGKYRYSPSPERSDRVMAHFYIYADESGKLEMNDFTSFCGYVGPLSEGERTCLEWDNCRFVWGVPPVHMRFIKEPERDKTGEWSKVKQRWGELWDDKRSAMLNQFAGVIQMSNLACVGAVTNAAHFRKMPPSPWKDQMHDPIFLCLHSLLMDGLDKIDTLTTSLPVSIIIDDDPQYAMECYKVLNRMRSLFPRVRERLVAITFGNDKQYPGLQMADMIAFESRGFMVGSLSDPTTKPSNRYRALTRSLTHQPKLWSAEFLDKVSQDAGESK